jgi:hypothetical protein
MEMAQGALLYVAALGIAWGGVAGLAALVHGYVRTGEAASRDTGVRRVDDLTS